MEKRSRTLRRGTTVPARQERARLLMEALEPRVLLSALPSVTIATTRNASELNPTTTGAGIFTLTRTGPTSAPLTVNYLIEPSSTAVNGTDFNVLDPLTGAVTFPAGAGRTTVVITPFDTGLADGTRTLLLDLAGNAPGPYTVGARHQATMSIADHAPTVTVSVTKGNASEIAGTTTGKGVFTIHRTGPTTSPLTVDFALGGTAVEGTDYLSLAAHSVTIPAKQTSVAVTINPIDDFLLEGKRSVTLTIVGDGAPASYHFKSTASSMNIADDTRAVAVSAPAPLPGATSGASFIISYDALVNATDVQVRSGHAPVFKVTAIASGKLNRDGRNIVLGSTTVAAGDSLVWTSRAGMTGTLAAFSVVAVDGGSRSAAAQIAINVNAPPVKLAPVYADALGQPDINVIAYSGNNTSPQYGVTTVINPATQQAGTANSFNVTALLDTASAGIVFSNSTSALLNLPTLSADGAPVTYTVNGAAGSATYGVSGQLQLALADSYPRNDLNQFTEPDAVAPETSPYTAMAGGTILAQIGTSTPLFDNPVADAASGTFPSLALSDVAGAPVMAGNVVVIDPTAARNLPGVLQSLLTPPFDVDPSQLAEDVSLHTYLYAPGTPFDAATASTNPGIPTTGLHVKLTYADMSGFGTVSTDGTAPTLASVPFIGENPIDILNGVSQPAVPGIKISRTVTNANGSVQTLSSNGNWLFDTGASSSIISLNQAANLGVSYSTGTFGTTSPVLMDQSGNALPNQFTMTVNTADGPQLMAGFYLDSLLIHTNEGSAFNDADPNNLVFAQDPVLVGNVTMQTSAGQTVTLDGVFGMNNLVPSADFAVTATGELARMQASAGSFNWITIDQPDGLLGLNLDPSVTGAHAAAAMTPLATTDASTGSLARGAVSSTGAVASPSVAAASPMTAAPLVQPMPAGKTGRDVLNVAATTTRAETTGAATASVAKTSSKFVTLTVSAEAPIAIGSLSATAQPSVSLDF